MIYRSTKALKVLLLITAIFALAAYLRNVLDIELSPTGLREWMLGMGPVAPIACVLLVMFRTLLGLPSHIVLLIPGLCFGAAMGTLYSTIGLLGSGVALFLIARYSGRDMIEARSSERYMALMRNLTGAKGAAALGALMAYPLTPLLPTQIVIGMTPMRFGLYVPAVLLAGFFRAAAYSFFGDSLVSGDAQPILEATALMALIIGVPLLIPRSRAWLRSWIAAGK